MAERRRREYRGAEGAERVEFGKGVSRVWGSGNAPSPENLSILSLKMATFSAFWALAHAARGPWPLPRPPLDPPVIVTVEMYGNAAPCLVTIIHSCLQFTQLSGVWSYRPGW